MILKRSTQTAVASMVQLARAYDDGKSRVSVSDIAESGVLHKPFVAKIMSVLSRAGLVAGSRGPGGGYTLAKAPLEITLYDVLCLFERIDPIAACPFDNIQCNKKQPCPVHGKLLNVEKQRADILHNTTFNEFCDTTMEQPVSPSDSRFGKPAM